MSRNYSTLHKVGLGLAAGTAVALVGKAAPAEASDGGSSLAPASAAQENANKEVDRLASNIALHGIKQADGSWLISKRIGERLYGSAVAESDDGNLEYVGVEITNEPANDPRSRQLYSSNFQRDEGDVWSSDQLTANPEHPNETSSVAVDKENSIVYGPHNTHEQNTGVAMRVIGEEALAALGVAVSFEDKGEVSLPLPPVIN
jgi:hypothetical protein